MSAHLDTLCEFLVETSLSDIPPSARERGCLIVADTIAAIAGGSAEPEVGELRDRLANYAGPSLVIGTHKATDPATAAFLNGTAGTFLEMDEGNPFTLGHPAIHVLPAALAAAQNWQCSGAKFLTALILGYEVAARIGIGCRMRPAMHPHGTWGTIGAAVAVAKLANVDGSKMRETINVASTLCLGASRQTMLEGGLIRNALAGHSGRMGLTVHDLVASGFTGENDGLATVWGEVLSDRWDARALSDELGIRWEVERNYFKRHACCRYNHGALDLLQSLRAVESFAVADVNKVRVETYSLAAKLTDRTPKNTLAGKFSMPFAIATTLVNGHSGLNSFTREMLFREDILAVAQKVEVREDSAMTDLLPGLRPARLIVELIDGRTFERYTETNKGDSVDPFEPEVLVEKYFELTTRVWSRAMAERVYDQARCIQALPDMRPFCSPPAQSGSG
jgi:2-methylcitrate dehydratase PrpD